MENIFNRLQFVKHEEIFATREDAVNYVLGKQTIDRPALLAEPMVLLYESEDAAKGPNVILAIGSVGSGVQSTTNRTFFIDTQKTEEEVEELDEKIEEAIKTLSIIPITSDTIAINADKTDEGTIVSGDVKIADYRIIDGVVVDNIIETEGEKGIYTFVDMDYDPETFALTFKTTKVSKEFQLPKDQHIVSGIYEPKDESIYLKLADGSDVKILVTKLIEEWTVLGEASTTPITLFKEHVSSTTEGHEGVYDWQDILRADVRVGEHIPNNILHKDRTGEYLYVKGTADNIMYSEDMSVKEAIDTKDVRISTSEGNLVYRRADGIYAYAMLDYSQAENKIIYSYTDGNSKNVKSVEFKLNSVKLLEDITYDPVKEEIVIRYIDAQGEYQRVEIPVKDIIEEWDVNNEGHDIKLSKYRSEGQGKDILTADAKIHEGHNNILEDLNHELYVRGESNNIKYDVTGNTTVKNVLDNISAATDSINDKLDTEIARSKAEDTKFDSTIGDGFSVNPNETITYKFNELQEQVNSEAEKLQNEIDRSTAKDDEEDGRLDSIETNIGEGFGPRNTVRDEFDKEKEEREASDNFLSGTIDTLSANTEGRLKSVVNNDHSIDVDNTDAVNPVIKVNLSTETEDNKDNIIKLNVDGLYAGVDLSYESTANKLIFKTTNETKEIQLEGMSSIVDMRYDPSKEAIIVTYITNGHEIKTFEIPVGDLIREWKPSENTNGAIKLTLTEAPSGTTEKDILYAEVLISDHEDNILINDGGTLYVSNQDIVSLEGRMDTAEADIDALENNLTEEISRAKDAERVLTDNIEQEVRDRIADVDAEETRAISAETALSDKIDADVLAEKNRAISSETQLQTNINTEASERESAILSETNRAISAETSLQTAIDNEISRATTAEENLLHSIDDEIENRISGDTILQSSIDNEESRAREIENRLEGWINKEITDRETADDALNTAITNETIRANSADTALYNAISDEQVVRANADLEIKELVTTEASRATIAESVLSGKIESEIERETTRASSAETELQIEIERVNSNLLERLSDEADRAYSAETKLSIDIISADTRAKNAEEALQTAIDNEISRATGADAELTNSINNERSARTNKDEELDQKILNEALRATSADTVLDTKIADERIERAEAVAELNTKIGNEVSRAQTQEGVISGNLNSEIDRSTREDERLSSAINSEIERAQNAEELLEDKIDSATLTFDDTTSIDFTKTTGNVITSDVKLQDGDNIIKIGQGLYATAHLSYDTGTNKIKLTTSAGEEEYQLAGATVIDDLVYDSTEKSLVITYHDGNGGVHTVNFPVAELFNEWDVQNPSENSSIELTKILATTPGGVDKISGRVLITNLDDNAISIVNNGLYVSRSAMENAEEISECTKNELKVFEKAILGSSISEECGSGYTYSAPIGSIYTSGADSVQQAILILDQTLNSASQDTGNVNEKLIEVSAKTDCAKEELKIVEQNILGMPLLNECGNGDTYRPNEVANYISAGTSFNSTDVILDREIKKTNDEVGLINQKVDLISGDSKCVEGKVDSIAKLSFGNSYTIPSCGEGAEYPVVSNGCIISAATSLYEADMLLDKAFCSMMDNWFLLGWDTPSNHTSVKEVGQNRHLVVDSRLSHGSHNGMSDEELVITDNNGPYIDPTRTEFTDTNIVRIIDITDGPDHTVLPADNPYNGIYVSNVWDCGLYYGTGDEDAKAAAEAAGYNVNYNTDESSSASSYDYMNNVRQADMEASN